MACIARAAAKTATVGTLTYGAFRGGKDLYHATNNDECCSTKAKMTLIGAIAGMMVSPEYAFGDLKDWYDRRTFVKKN